MKLPLLSALVLMSAGALAQGRLSPQQVCAEVSRNDGGHGRNCFAIIGRARIGQSALDVAYTLATIGANVRAIEVLEAAQNVYLDFGVGAVCSKLAEQRKAPQAVQCVKGAIGQYFDKGLLDLAYTMADLKQADNTLVVLNAGKNAAIQDRAAKVCEEIARRKSGAMAAECLTGIVNKEYDRRTLETAEGLVRQTSYGAARNLLTSSGRIASRRPGRGDNRGDGDRDDGRGQGGGRDDGRGQGGGRDDGRGQGGGRDDGRGQGGGRDDGRGQGGGRGNGNNDDGRRGGGGGNW
jgi:hypothetical protein